MGSNGATASGVCIEWRGASASGVCIEWGAMVLLLVEYALSGSNGATASGVGIEWEQWCYC